MAGSRSALDEQRHIVMIEIGEKRTQFVDRPGSRERLAVGTGGERKAVGNPTAIRGKQGIELAIAGGCGREFMFKGHHPRKLVFA